MSEEPTGTTSTRERQPTNPAALIRHAKMSYENFLEWADEDTLAEWVDVAWLWQTPSPVVEDVLLGVAGADYANYLLEHLRQRGYLTNE